MNDSFHELFINVSLIELNAFFKTLNKLDKDLLCLDFPTVNNILY